MTIKKYIDSINTSLYGKGIISAVLYDPLFDTHLYLFDFEYDEYGNKFCTMLSEPVCKKLPYVELSLPFVDSLDKYYSTYYPVTNSYDIGQHYTLVKKRLKIREKEYLEEE